MKTEPVEKLLSHSSSSSWWYRERYQNYRALEEEVLKKATALFLPVSLKTKLADIIKPIGSEIFTWISERDDQYLSLCDLYKRGCSLCWTMEGTIDKISSLKNLLKDKLMNKEKQENSFADLYSLACKYCLEEYIPILWSNIPSKIKSAFDFVSDNYRDHIVNYWTANLKDELPLLLQELEQHTSSRSSFLDNFQYGGKVYDTNQNIFLNMISLSLCVGNVVALKYFWSKLSDEEKDVNVENWLIKILKSDYFYRDYECYSVRTEIFCFLLSQVRNQTRLNGIFKSFSRKILRSLFFNWPFQRFLLPTISMMLPYLNEYTYLKIMLDVTKKMEEEKTAHSVFKNIWHISPLKVKGMFFCEETRCSTRAIVQFLNVGDIEMAYTMKEAAASHWREIIWTMARNLLYTDNFKLIDTFLSNALSEEDLHSFRKQAVGYSTEKVCFDWIRGELENSFEAAQIFLDWSLQSLYEVGDWFHSIETFYQDYTLGFNAMLIYVRLAFLGNYKRVDRFLAWHFRNPEAIYEFKALVRKDCSYEIASIFNSVSKSDNDMWGHLENFLNYILQSCSSEEKTQFKNLYLKHVESLVFEKHLEFVSKFLNWCYESDEEINQFKHQLLLSEKHIDYIFNSLVHPEFGCINWWWIKYNMKWFCPLSSELISNLKSKLSPLLVDTDSCQKCRQECFRQEIGRAFFHILDGLDYEDSNSECESDSTDESHLSCMFDELMQLETPEGESHVDSDNEDVCSVNTYVIDLISTDWDSDSYCSDSDDAQNVPDYDDEVLLLVTQMVNTVERLNQL